MSVNVIYVFSVTSYIHKHVTKVGPVLAALLH